MFDVLIISRPGMLRDSLSALLGTTAGINVVSVTNDLDSALEFVSEHQPLVCIMDYSNQVDNKVEKLDQMILLLPEIMTIALVDDVKTKEVAEAVGFNKVVIKGSSVEILTKAVTEFINENLTEAENSG